MKKRNLKTLKLNKKSISNFRKIQIVGGNSNGTENASVCCFEQPQTGVVTCPTVSCEAC